MKKVGKIKVKRVQKSDWKTIDMPEKTEKFLLEKKLTNEDINILQNGFLPQEMEDKWFVYCDNNRLYIHRSWTGFCIYIVSFASDQYHHEVIVNRDVNQYKETNIHRDQLNLTILLNSLTGHKKENQKLMLQYMKMKS